MSTTQPIKDKTALENFKNYYLAKQNFRNYSLIVTGLNTALRISDLLSLQWKNVYDFSSRYFFKHIRITEQKTGKQSIIAMNSSVKNSLSILLNSKSRCPRLPDDYIFNSSKNPQMPLSRYQAYRIIREAASAAHLEEPVSCHSLRKTFGYFAWKEGVPPAMLMNIYNHSSYQITKKYLCIEQDDRDEVFLNINI